LINNGQGTQLQNLQAKIAAILKTQQAFVDIFSISDVVGETQLVDVIYAAHGSPYYTPEKMNALMWSSRADVSPYNININLWLVDLERNISKNLLN